MVKSTRSLNHKISKRNRDEDHNTSREHGYTTKYSFMPNITEKQAEANFIKHHFLPDVFPAARHPTQYPVKTHVTSPVMRKVLKSDNVGDFMIYFNPVIAAWEPVRRGLYEQVPLTYPPDTFIYYADHGGMGMVSVPATVAPGATTVPPPTLQPNTVKNTNSTLFKPCIQLDINGLPTRLTPVSNWPTAINGLPGGEHFQKLKVTAASVSVNYVGNEDKISGTMKIIMGLKPFNASTNVLTMNPIELDNYPMFSEQHARDEAYVRYTIPDNDFHDFGPYGTFKAVPFYLIYGEGLPPNEPFSVVVTRTIEGVVTPAMQEFVNAERPLGNPDLIKAVMTKINKIINDLGSGSTITKADVTEALKKGLNA